MDQGRGRDRRPLQGHARRHQGRRHAGLPAHPAVHALAQGGARRRHPRADGDRRARRARGADGAARPEGGGGARRRAAQARQDHAHHAARRHRPHGQARRISDHDPVRLCRERRPLRPLGRRPRPHLPERRLGQRHRRVRSRATSSCCPIAATCRTRCGSTSATASSARSKAGSTPS